jgi:pyochelin synthetase
VTGPARTAQQDIPALLSELARRGIKLRIIDDDQLQVTAPRGGISDDLRSRISAHKSGLVEWLASERTDGAASSTVIVHDPDNLYEPFPPSDMQSSFLIGSTDGFEYHVRPHQYMELDFGELDPARFESALNAALARQRANLVTVTDDAQLAVVGELAPVTVRVQDLRDLPQEQADARIEQVRAEMARQELPLDQWPWMDVRISRYGAGRARLHYNNNNFFCDAPATMRFLDAVMHYYNTPDEPLPDLTLSYRDCVLALAELEKTPKGLAAEKYWRDRMADWPDAPSLPMVPGADTRKRSLLERRDFALPEHLWTALKAAGSARGLTPTAVFYGVYAEVIAYWSGSRHFLINNMITHRQPIHPEIAEVLGNLSSLYPLEVDWRHNEPFESRAKRLQAQLMADMDQVHWSGVKVLQALNQVRGTPGRAVCPLAIGSALFVGPADPPLVSVLETPQVVFDCEIWELRDGSLWVVWDVIESLFPDGLIDDMQHACSSILTELAENDEAWGQAAFDLLPARQRREREQVNASAAPRTGQFLHECLPERAAEPGTKTAVISPDSALSYRELHTLATRIARRLQDNGTRPGDLVAVTVPKDPQQVAAVMGVLTAGGAYVPMDPAWPRERLQHLLNATSARVLLISAAQRDSFRFSPVPVLAIDDIDDAGEPEPAPRQPGDLAYVIYTSGSTGQPKGAMLSHAGPLATIAAVNSEFGVGASDVIFGVSSICFDLSVYDIFGTLAAGATLVLPGASQADPASWVQTVRESSVTVWNSVPAIMELFTEAAQSSGTKLPALRLVLLSGDWIPVHLPAKVRKVAPNARVVSLGGATEASIWSIFHPVDREDPDWVSIPYGKPLPGQTWHVLDELGRDLPVGVAGDLYIGGAGVALGYLNDPGRTAASFVRHPRTGERLYRTGDVGRYLPSLDIEFLGRSDFQVKIQGFRVEPGEIEHVLTTCPGVRSAAVVVRSSGSGRQLAAFVAGDRTRAELDTGAIQHFLAGKLPSYMVPSYITVLDRLPLTGNGKLDRRALVNIGSAAEDTAAHTHTSPRTETEAVIARVWEEVLSVTPVGVHDDFFALGGQSFAALRMTGILAGRLGRRIPLGIMLERRTVARLAEWVQEAAQAWTPLVAMREDDCQDHDPWCFVHPAGGNVLCYRELAGLLESPFYAFQAPGPATGHEPLDDVTELAARYVDALLAALPRDAYQLGGWSSGAVIAAEMTHQLEQRGKTVTRLVVIDAPAPVAPREADDVTTLLWFLEDLGIGFDPRTVSPDDRNRLATLPERDRLAAAVTLAPGSLDSEELQPALEVFRSIVHACNSYQAPRLTAAITVLRARDGEVSEFADHPFSGSPDWGWATLSRAEVDVARVHGTHHTLLTDHVTAVAEVIMGRLPAGREP